MKELSEIRKTIDSIDEQLCNLVTQRLSIMGDVAEAKHRQGKPLFDPERERTILNRMMDQAGPEYEKEIRLLFSTLFDVSKARQRALQGATSPISEAILRAAGEAKEFPARSLVACPGTEGAYSQQATSLMFDVPTILYFNSFDKVFEAVESGLCPYGILPIENSAAGSVGSVYDAMVKHKFHIVKSRRLRINHVLLANPGATLAGIQEVSSHPQALSQCGIYLKKHPEFKTVPESNTAVAAKLLKESGSLDKAVIASRDCAELYGLTVLDENLADVPNNYTRFICISKNMEIFRDASKISIMLMLPHKPGSLHDLLARFSAIDVNLTKLESRPVPGMDFEFLFTFDFEASPTDPRVLQLLSELSSDPSITHFTFLGAYGEH